MNICRTITCTPIGLKALTRPILLSFSGVGVRSAENFARPCSHVSAGSLPRRGDMDPSAPGPVSQSSTEDTGLLGPRPVDDRGWGIRLVFPA